MICPVRIVCRLQFFDFFFISVYNRSIQIVLFSLRLFIVQSECFLCKTYRSAIYLISDTGLKPLKEVSCFNTIGSINHCVVNSAAIPHDVFHRNSEESCDSTSKVLNLSVSTGFIACKLSDCGRKVGEECHIRTINSVSEGCRKRRHDISCIRKHIQRIQFSDQLHAKLLRPNNHKRLIFFRVFSHRVDDGCKRRRCNGRGNNSGKHSRSLFDFLRSSALHLHERILQHIDCSCWLCHK